MTRVNVITGFLGSGKTTTLRHLLACKPTQERWAILVNEFGEIGIDGALLADSGAQLKEIPGGCMCCVNGLPMQIGLNMLLKTQPDRLLIEPTGLGHPKQILRLLESNVYSAWLTLQATLCLLDARQLNDERLQNNENFRDQLAAADIIVANKMDTYDGDACDALRHWQLAQGDERTLLETQHGQIDPAWLDRPRTHTTTLPDAHHHHTPSAPVSGIAALRLRPGQGWRRALNQDQGYFSCGWIFSEESVFDTIGLLEWVRLTPLLRIKGAVRIVEGTLCINRQGTDLQIETRQTPPPDSRIEVIHDAEADWNALQSALLALRIRRQETPTI
ncbi:GTP-binding protein [Edwardsiella ictaluri]|uniref:CobW/P47K family protein n=1 Tax=Edwardsiella ictaluri (strain 93-146) TaxID=634503 RepID=C5BG33_EDWI9|nr:GTP-binding protein [Edwardsiella ictaluri]ACR69756.1 CobW/P47K family protein [Edwardsiella ictaluri 93-146]AVZ83283.1 GTP-binding protein [Edwardsiella ictaluri]EKS7761841.1 GTP-binding protein [Edwardsiella ictaluri]EKS7768651.1 GTP-binding protein [Edwardsiella ictaluri]EKS7772031.1 GTP-binding protein [Edwardsiella ictaluri]